MRQDVPQHDATKPWQFSLRTLTLGSAFVSLIAAAAGGAFGKPLQAALFLMAVNLCFPALYSFGVIITALTFVWVIESICRALGRPQ
jgi:hypothetical protein